MTHMSLYLILAPSRTIRFVTLGPEEVEIIEIINSSA
jgi:hypothetical protein